VHGGVRFRILGPLEGWVGDARLPLRGRRQETTLAVLLLAAGQTVTLSQLVDAVWDDPPSTARRQIQDLVGGLRRSLLTHAGREDLVLTQRAGYLLQLASDELDAHRFERLVAAARAEATSEPATAAGTLKAALALCRGPTLAGITSRALVPAVARWEEHRLAVHEQWLELELSLGHHQHVLGELLALVAHHPLRERPVRLLMRALHRAGRSPEALAAYQRLQRQLTEGLGIDPSTDLQELHRAILRGHPALRDPDPAGTATPAAAPTAAPATPAAVAPTVPPAQLPPDLAVFTGREDALKRLDELIDANPGTGSPAVVISAIAGTAGIGKTALAVHWAHRVADRFPDGQLYANLRGFGAAREPNQNHGGDRSRVASSAEAVRGFLEALGIPPGRIPAELPAQVGLYRSLLAGRRVLVVLDNARDADQVRPLLPGAAGCLAVVTSRNQLAGLVATEGAQPLRLDLPSVAEARELLARRLGADRVAAEPAAVDEIIARCARLPLALAVVAASAAIHPESSLARLADQLHRATGGLATLAGGDPATDVEAAFSWSYAALSPAAARLFRLLGLDPGPDISARAAASLGNLTPARASDIFTELTRASVIAESAPGRYASHDLLRAYAADLTRTRDPARVRRAATSRLLDYYLHSAYLADRRTNPHREPIDLPAAAPSRPAVEQFTSDQTARDWLGVEYPNLVASIEWAATGGYDRHCWQLAWALDTFLDRRGDWRQLMSTWQIALGAAGRAGDLAAQAYAHRRLGYAETRLGRHAEGHATLNRALDLYQAIADHAGQANTHHVLAARSRLQGDCRRALDHARQALALFQSAGNHRGQAAALNSVGWYLALLGDHDEALAHCRRALTLSQRIDDRYGQAHVWDNLGVAHHHAGQYGRATDCLQQAAELFHALGERYYAAATSTRLGDAYLADRKPGAARTAWRRALDVLTDLDHPDLDQVRARLDDLRRTAGGDSAVPNA
jgi:DNA-binding SARP family transcriptional activator/Tfp pilus assembly protein PilF